MSMHLKKSEQERGAVEMLCVSVRAERGTIPGRLHGSHRRNRNELQRVVVRPLSWLEMGCCAALHRSLGQWIAINPEGVCRHFKVCSILPAQCTREAEGDE